MHGRWFQVVAAAMFINTSYGTLSYSFSVLVTKEAAGGDLGKTVVAIAFAAALMVSGVAALMVGTVADVFGSRRLMAAGSLAGAAGMVLFGLCSEGWQAILVLSVVVGPGMAATFYEPVYVLMNRWFDADERPRAYGVLTLVSGFSITIFTPLTGQLVDSFGWRPAVFTLAGILAVVGTVVPMLMLSEPRETTKTPAHLGNVWRETFAGLRQGDARFWGFTVAFFAGTAAVSGFSFHVVAELEAKGFDPVQTARVIALAGIVSLPMRLILPALSGRVSSVALLNVCLVVLGFSAVLAARTDAWWQVWLYVAVYGSVFGAIYPLRALVTSERFDTAYFGRLLGAQALFVAAGRAVGPAAVGIAAGNGSYSPSFEISAVVLILSAVAIGYVLRAQKELVIESQAAPIEP